MAMARMEGQGMTPETPASRPGMDQLKQSRPGEAELIIKALAQRLRNLTPKPQTQPTQPTQIQ
jgi:hypothetical protein